MTMTVWTIVAGIIMLLGIASAIIPFLPGPPLAWAGLTLYAVVTHFSKISATAVLVFGLLVALTVILEIFAPALVARGYKATRMGVWGAVTGALLGIFMFGPIGVVVGPLLGGFVGELLAAGNSQKALRTAWGAFVGFLVGTFLKLLTTVIIAAYFVYKLF